MDSMSLYTKLYITADHLSKDIWMVILLAVGSLILNMYLFSFSSDKYITIADRKVRAITDVISISIITICFVTVVVDNYAYWELTKLGMSYNEIHNLIINSEHTCK